MWSILGEVFTGCLRPAMLQLPDPLSGASMPPNAPANGRRSFMLTASVAALGAVPLGSAAQVSPGASATSAISATTPTAAASAPKRVLFVVTNQVNPGPAGFPIGYWLAELAHPFWAFQQRDWTTTIVSPNGGAVIHDAMSDPEGGRFGPANDFLSIGFKHSARVAPLLAATGKLADARVDDHDAIFVVGGLGPMVTFADNETLHRLFAAFHDSGRVAASLCHGSVVLLKARGADGKLIAEGRQWTGFCNLEEDVVDKAYSTKVQPFRIEDEARKIPNARFVQGAPFRPFAVRDGRLVTGQQGSSGALTAELVVEALKG